MLPQAGEDVVGGHHLIDVPLLARAQRHLFDKTQLQAAVQAELGEGNDIVFVHAGHDHRVDLDGVKARRGRRVEGGDDAGQPVAPGKRAVALGVDGVEGHVDAIQPGVGEGAGLLVQAQPIGGQRRGGSGALVGGESFRRGDDVRETAPEQRLAAGETHLPNAQLFHP